MKVWHTFILAGLLLLLAACGAAGASNLPKQYPFEEAAKNGDVVNLHGKLANLDHLESFVSSVEKKEKASVRITQYTTEGDPVITQLSYNGQSIDCTVDTTRDRFGEQKLEKSTADSIRKRSKDIDFGEGISRSFWAYTLASGNNQEGRDILLIAKE